MSEFLKLNIISINANSGKFKKDVIYINADLIIGFYKYNIPKLGQTEQEYLHCEDNPEGTLIKLKKEAVNFIDEELNRPETGYLFAPGSIGIEKGDCRFFIKNKTSEILNKL